MYVGITANSLEERWQLSIASASNLVKTYAAYEKAAPGSLQEKRTGKKIARSLDSMDHDIMTMGSGPDVWDVEVLATSESFVEGLLIEQEQIAKLNTRDPKVGYNRSKGGEMPKYITIDYFLREVERLGIKNLKSRWQF